MTPSLPRPISSVVITLPESESSTASTGLLPRQPTKMRLLARSNAMPVGSSQPIVFHSAVIVRVMTLIFATALRSRSAMKRLPSPSGTVPSSFLLSIGSLPRTDPVFASMKAIALPSPMVKAICLVAGS